MDMEGRKGKIVSLNLSIHRCFNSRTDRCTDRLEFWHGGQVEGYLGQGHGSKVKVTRFH